ncbi:SDR family oxidoreductase [Rhizobium rhizogenes]
MVGRRDRQLCRSRAHPRCAGRYENKENRYGKTGKQGRYHHRGCQRHRCGDGSAFFDQGAKVVVTDMRIDEGQDAARAIDPTGKRVTFIELDVTNEDRWDKAVDEAVAIFGKLDILVNAAGVGAMANVEDETYERWKWFQEINLGGVFLGTRAAIKGMKANGAGSIINIASIEAHVGDPALAAYNASKGGVKIFSKSAALHCAKSGLGIRINTVSPGYIKTPMLEGVVNATEDPDATWEALIGAHPIGRLGVPDDIAYAILYLASDESTFVTGADFLIDGGYTAQ